MPGSLVDILCTVAAILRHGSGLIGLSETFELETALGLLFMGLTLYASTLSYTLRGYSRGRLAGHLSREQQNLWFERLDHALFELQNTASFLRISAIVATLTWTILRYFGDATVTLDLNLIAVPTLISLGVLLVVAIGVPHAVAGHVGEAILARSLFPVVDAAVFVLSGRKNPRRH